MASNLYRPCSPDRLQTTTDLSVLPCLRHRRMRLFGHSWLSPPGFLSLGCIELTSAGSLRPELAVSRYNKRARWFRMPAWSRVDVPAVSGDCASRNLTHRLSNSHAKHATENRNRLCETWLLVGYLWSIPASSYRQPSATCQRIGCLRAVRAGES